MGVIALLLASRIQPPTVPGLQHLSGSLVMWICADVAHTWAKGWQSLAVSRLSYDARAASVRCTTHSREVAAKRLMNATPVVKEPTRLQFQLQLKRVHLMY